jgi:hypothetical protein
MPTGKGVPRFKCPYPPDTREARDWLAGWDEAARSMLESEAAKGAATGGRPSRA